jgi:tRNA U54 and U55 pseudouridine synthase Pus10
VDIINYVIGSLSYAVFNIVLGNGRPFVLEVLDASRKPTSEALAAIRSHILSGRGLNALFDVEVLWLAEVPRNVWLGMQTAAEEKCKAYNCVVRAYEFLDRS